MASYGSIYSSHFRGQQGTCWGLCLLTGLTHWAAHLLAVHWSGPDLTGLPEQLESAPCVLHVPAGHLGHVLVEMIESQGKARLLESLTWSTFLSFYWPEPGTWSSSETEAEDASKLNGEGDADRVKNQGPVCNEFTTPLIESINKTCWALFRKSFHTHAEFSTVSLLPLQAAMTFLLQLPN